VYSFLTRILTHLVGGQISLVMDANTPWQSGETKRRLGNSYFFLSPDPILPLNQRIAFTESHKFLSVLTLPDCTPSMECGIVSLPHAACRQFYSANFKNDSQFLGEANQKLVSCPSPWDLRWCCWEEETMGVMVWREEELALRGSWPYLPLWWLIDCRQKK
jgi:hypothetical protein